MSIGTSEHIQEWKAEHGNIDGLTLQRTWISLTSRESATVSLQTEKLGFENKSQFIRWAVNFALGKFDDVNKKVREKISGIEKLITFTERGILPTQLFVTDETICEALIERLVEDEQQVANIKKFVSASDNMTYSRYLSKVATEYLTRLAEAEIGRNNALEAKARVESQIEHLQENKAQLIEDSKKASEYTSEIEEERNNLNILLDNIENVGIQVTEEKNVVIPQLSLLSSHIFCENLVKMLVFEQSKIDVVEGLLESMGINTKEWADKIPEDRLKAQGYGKYVELALTDYAQLNLRHVDSLNREEELKKENDELKEKIANSFCAKVRSFFKKKDK